MKKILTTLAMSGIALGAFGQGYVNWSASPAGNLISQTNSITYSGLSAALGGGLATGNSGGAAAQGNTAGFAGNLYYYELLYSTVDTTTPTTLADLAANWTATGLHAEDSLTGNNGRINPLAGTTATQIDPTYAGGTLDLMVVGWSANLGTTFAGVGGVLSELQNWGGSFAQLQNAYFGESYVGQGVLSTSSASGTTIYAPAQTVGGFISNPSSSPMVLNSLQAVPEPGTMALAALGGASLLLFRRKK
jgi:hypothetical protein